MKKNYIPILSAILIIMSATPIYANIIWPAMFVVSAFYSSLFLVIISIVIEGLLLHMFIKNISYAKAILISLVGNTASAIVGALFMGFAMILWHAIFDTLLGGTFSKANIIATYILMYLGSSFIELITIRRLFHYTTKKLLAPVLIGNLLTYILIALYHYKDFIKAIPT